MKRSSAAAAALLALPTAALADPQGISRFAPVQRPVLPLDPETRWEVRRRA